MIREPNTVPIPAPDPATPTVAAPAPMNLAAVSISRAWAETERGLNENDENFEGTEDGKINLLEVKKDCAS